MAPTRSETLASLVRYLTLVGSDLHLAAIIAAEAHLPELSAASRTAQSDAIELVFFASDDQTSVDVRSRFVLASAELEPLEVIAQTLGAPTHDIAGFKKMLSTKGDSRRLEAGRTSAGSTESPSASDFMTVVVHALHPPPSTAPSATAPPSEQFSVLRVLNVELPSSPKAFPELEKLGANADQLEDWRHILARGIREPWDKVLQAKGVAEGKTDPGLGVVSEMAILRGMERWVLPAQRGRGIC